MAKSSDGLVEILVQKEKSQAFARQSLAGGGIVADLDAVADLDLVGFDGHGAVNFHLCVLLSLSCRTGSRSRRPVVVNRAPRGSPRPCRR